MNHPKIKRRMLMYRSEESSLSFTKNVHYVQLNEVHSQELKQVQCQELKQVHYV